MSENEQQAGLTELEKTQQPHQKKDKKEIVGEIFSEDQLRSLLVVSPYDAGDVDFYILERAYRKLPIEAFDAFLSIFIQEGHSLDAKNAQGETLLNQLEKHPTQQNYRMLLLQYSV
jgi:hypothetical protein